MIVDEQSSANGSGWERKHGSAPSYNGVTQSARPDDAPATLAEALSRAAQSDRGMSFLDVQGNQETVLPYAEIRERALLLARRLLGLGLRRGDAVGIIALVQADFVCAFFACQYAGLVAVPLPLVNGIGAARGYQQQLTQVLKISRARVALGPTSFLPHLQQAAEGLDLRAICTVPDLQAMPASEHPGRPLGADEISHIQFSSGSTAFPKGITISQRALMANLLGIIHDGVKVTPADRIASWLPFYHDMGLIGAMLVPTVAAINADYLPTDAFVRRPHLWLQMISRLRSTISFSPSFGYDLATRRAIGRPDTTLDLSCWRVAGLGGDMVQKTVLDRFAETFAAVGFNPKAFMPSYGLAESTLAVTFTPPGEGMAYDRVEQSSLEQLGRKVVPVGADAPNARNVVACGRVLAEHGIEIRDETSRAMPERHIGAVFVKGASLMDGYYQNEDATRECLTRDGWLDTGDMGYLSGGLLYITGRRKDMIIINARNIWPQDIEWHAEQAVPGLRTRDTAAFMHHDQEGGERAVLLVQCRLTNPADLERLQKEVHSAVLRNVGVDCQVELVPPKTLPYTTSGKLMRAQARQRWLELRHNGQNGHNGNGHAASNHPFDNCHDALPVPS